MCCKTCGDNSGNKQYCDFCDKLYFKDEVLRKRAEPVKPEKVSQLKEACCETCGNTFMQEIWRQKYCNGECRPKKLTPAEAWIARKAPIANGVRNDQVAYSHFKKQYMPSIRFNACRG